MDTNILKYKMRLSIMIVICIKQPLSNISSSIHKKVKAEAELKEKLFHKKACGGFSKLLPKTPR